MVEKLDTDRLKLVLQEADNTWFRDHSGDFNYQKYLDFVAEYVSKNYNRKSRRKNGQLIQ